ncbi:MAG: NADH:ubiquinone reductase (Na(+)-transporting) subunit B [Gammaproteobacteria bacterium]|nr:NADH:ubiquinone reductase (Na(+)-transporting) subunit B [Gammaproteobacteria bacterium]NIM72685.1 NADH:ubiquinone reductase (Na(+)-transporting) subunit B [Gammaproteobacteria bacterium]NIN37743.1 NADH:ubiquinone reductase (Na(+)-transporting) subunit B [Gammaproteobacteria bacterium]NIO24446.1 NADH:ubiquinone reductase (Na(+)-transporting) subunit B [Gammaproteobacteria bacterium]NIO65049.1 NADH:ubiquinone reductase (Na(+)-transporting) subunit B [Gammaproteobacteria bacterium]
MSPRIRTAAAPHARARSSLARIQTIRLLALVPALIAAVINTGYQYLAALRAVGGIEDGDWRDHLIAGLGLNYAEPSWLDIITAGLVHVLPVLVTALIVGGVWEQAFAIVRRRRRESGLLVIAVLMTLLMPPAVSMAHLAFGMSFAIIFGKAIFGGEGKTFLNPAVLGAAVLLISFPTALAGHPLWTGIVGYAGTRAFALYAGSGGEALAAAGIDGWHALLGNVQGMMGTTSLVAIALGGAVLVATRIASWRLILGQLLGLVTAVALCNAFGEGAGIATLAWHWHLLLGGFAFGAVFLATDPASSASTNAGRWVQGLIVGALVVMIRVGNPAHPDGAILAVLMGSVLAPLIDQVVVWFNVRKRARAHG